MFVQCECPTRQTIEEGGESKGQSKKENEIIYLRYDNDNMKYIYLCAIANIHGLIIN